MAELETQIQRFTEDLIRKNWSAHSVRAYRSDLQSFVDCFETEPVPLAAVKVCHVRAWMEALWNKQLSAKSIRRHIASLKAFFQFLCRTGVATSNPVRLVRIPRMGHSLPEVLTAKQTGSLIDGVETMGERQLIRDLSIFELLYGCGLRVGELVGLNLEDIDHEECWLLVRGKGRKERQVPYGAKAAAALQNYLSFRSAYLAPGYRGPGRNARRERHRVQPGSRKGYENISAVFLNKDRKRLSDRQVRNIVKKYGIGLMGNPDIHPHSFRHAFATHMLDSGANLREIQELLGHASLSSTQIYTQVSIDALTAVYDNAHPRSDR